MNAEREIVQKMPAVIGEAFFIVNLITILSK